MPENAPALFTEAYIAAFQKLYAQFGTINKLQPWTLIDETVILGVQHPVTGAIWYAYFMGEAGETVGFNIYPETEIGNWLKISEMLHSNSAESPHMDMLLQTFYQLATEIKTKAAPELVQLHKAAGIVVERRSRGYLDAVSYRTGYTPTLVTATDMEVLHTLLPGFQYLLEEVASGEQSGRALSVLTHTGHAIVAIPKEGGSWETEVQPIPAAQPRNIYATAQNGDLIWESLRPVPRTEEAYLIYAGVLPIPFTNADGEGAFVIMIMLFAAESGEILGTEQVPINEWKESAAPALAGLMRKTGKLPAAILAGETDFLPLVQSMGKALDIIVEVNPEITTLGDETLADFIEMMHGDDTL